MVSSTQMGDRYHHQEDTGHPAIFCEKPRVLGFCSDMEEPDDCVGRKKGGVCGAEREFGCRKKGRGSGKLLAVVVATAASI